MPSRRSISQRNKSNKSNKHHNHRHNHRRKPYESANPSTSTLDRLSAINRQSPFGELYDDMERGIASQLKQEARKAKQRRKGNGSTTRAATFLDAMDLDDIVERHRDDYFTPTTTGTLWTSVPNTVPEDVTRALIYADLDTSLEAVYICLAVEGWTLLVGEPALSKQRKLVEEARTPLRYNGLTEQLLSRAVKLTYKPHSSTPYADPIELRPHCSTDYTSWQSKASNNTGLSKSAIGTAGLIWALSQIKGVNEEHRQAYHDAIKSWLNLIDQNADYIRSTLDLANSKHPK